VIAYIFMNENIRSEKTRHLPCIMVARGPADIIECTGVQWSGPGNGMALSSVGDCPFIDTHHVHAWVMVDALRILVQQKGRWVTLRTAVSVAELVQAPG
jgi:hypothetical protein